MVRVDRGGDFTADEAAEALAWWVDAGVDAGAVEEPRDWLATPRNAAAVEVPVHTPPVGLPATLADFVRWRLEGDDAPEARWGGPRLGPPAVERRPLMVLVDFPEGDDRVTLLGGAAGRLLDRMLAAVGMTRGDIHLAPLSWARPPGGAIPPDAAERLAALARQHITLAAPERLLLMGGATSRAVLGIDLGGGATRQGVVQHQGSEWPTVATWPPRLLIEKPAAKAAVWRDLLCVTGESL